MTYMDYNNSSRQFRPWGSRVMALSIKCDYLALSTNWVTKDFLQTHGRAIGTKTAVSSKIETAIIDQHNTNRCYGRDISMTYFPYGTLIERTRVMGSWEDLKLYTLSTL